MNYNDGKTIADRQKDRILSFVASAYDEAVKDGTNDMTITLHIKPNYEEFTVDKSGVVRREKKKVPCSECKWHREATGVPFIECHHPKWGHIAKIDIFGINCEDGETE